MRKDGRRGEFGEILGDYGQPAALRSKITGIAHKQTNSRQNRKVNKAGLAYVGLCEVLRTRLTPWKCNGAFAGDSHDLHLRPKQNAAGQAVGDQGGDWVPVAKQIDFSLDKYLQGYESHPALRKELKEYASGQIGKRGTGEI
jgi:hypothetical protein